MTYNGNFDQDVRKLGNLMNNQPLSKCCGKEPYKNVGGIECYGCGKPFIPEEEPTRIGGAEFHTFWKKEFNEDAKVIDMLEGQEQNGWAKEYDEFISVHKGCFTDIKGTNEVIKRFIRQLLEKERDIGYKDAERKVQAFYKARKTGKLGREDMQKAFQAGCTETIKNLQEKVRGINVEEMFVEELKEQMLSLLEAELK